MIDLSAIQEIYMSVVQACPSLYMNYGSKIWDACSESHSNVVFNECTATIIAIGISIGAGALGWRAGGSGNAGGGSSSDGPHLGDQGESETPLADNLPPDLRTYDKLSDFHDITTWGNSTE